MKTALYRLLCLLLLACSVSGTAQTKYAENARAYVERYKELAMAEQQRTGMPAAIKLAQGIYETGAGTSELATQANNHFGMKCKRNWTGETFAHTDDAPDECFRKYPSAEESYRDQSNYLKGNPRYAACFATDVKDYNGWAIQLRKAGYATNPKYAALITKTVEDFGLQQYTLQALDMPVAEVIPEADKPTVAQEVRQEVKELLQDAKTLPTRLKDGLESTFRKTPAGQLETYKGLQGFYATAGQSLLEDATRYNVRYAKLLEWNDLPDAPVPFDMFIFLEKKPARGTAERHTVKGTETLLNVAQLEAIQLRSLRELNMLDIGEEPQEGAVLRLQTAASAKPPTYLTGTRKAPAAIETHVAATTAETGWISKTSLEDAAPTDITTAAVAITPVATEPQPIDPAPATPEPVATTSVESAAPATAAAIPSAVGYDDSALGRLKAKMDKAVYAKPNQAPAEAPTPAKAPEVDPVPEAVNRPSYHTVAKGETVFGIAKKYGVSVTDLRKWNKMEFSAMKTGQKLRIKP
jgi:hypothetical protein